jgi:hypothetical protein
MAEPIISFIPQNDKEFSDALQKLGENVDDFRVPFQLIGNHWYKGNRKIFALKSAGLYPDYGGMNPNDKVRLKGRLVTKRVAAKFQKQREVGFIYPMLKRHGGLEASLISKSGAGSVFFAGRQTMIMGTNVEHAKYHQSDRPRKVLPQRKMIFIDGGPAELAKDAVVSGRLEAWTNIVVDYVNQVITGSARV